MNNGAYEWFEIGKRGQTHVYTRVIKSPKLGTETKRFSILFSLVACKLQFNNTLYQSNTPTKANSMSILTHMLLKYLFLNVKTNRQKLLKQREQMLQELSPFD